LYANAQVGLWFGHFMQPDWDMFQSGHAFGAFHAAGRALSGGPVYVSDKPGEHDFALLRKLVCSDGSVLRAEGVGLPTLDTLCVDPTCEAVPLKIWNTHGAAALVGVFHARYAAGRAEPVSGALRIADVPGLQGQRFACHAHNAQRLERLERGVERPFTLAEREFEIFSLVPIESGWAALGLSDKFNGPVAVVDVEWTGPDACTVRVRDVGEFLAYSERRPRQVHVGSPADAAAALPFSYDPACFALRISLAGEASLRFSVVW
jgi:raffinose synthase